MSMKITQSAKGRPSSVQAPIAHEQAVAILPMKLPFESSQLNCPQCHKSVMSHTEFKTGAYTWFCCMWYIGCFAFCLDSTKDLEHSCPACGYCFGRANRMN